MKLYNLKVKGCNCANWLHDKLLYKNHQTWDMDFAVGSKSFCVLKSQKAAVYVVLCHIMKEISPCMINSVDFVLDPIHAYMFDFCKALNSTRGFISLFRSHET